MPVSHLRLSLLLAAALLWTLPSAAQPQAEAADQGTSIKELDSRKPKKEEPRPQLTDEERRERLRNYKKEVSKSYRAWLDEDVKWIISDEEEKAFKMLANDEERDQFIEQFWLRRDPTPDTPENEFRDEHYRRINYANDHFSAGIPGWRTDRGHIYVVWGPPDEIESHAAGGTYQRQQSEGGGTTSTYPFERWRYRYLEGIGSEIIVEFVDSCMCNEYKIALSPDEKDALLHTPGGGATLNEEMGRGSRADRMMQSPKDPFRLNGGNQFEALERYAKLTAPPPVKFKDLEEKVNSRIRYNLMPFDLRIDFVRVTSDTVLVPFTIQIKTREMTFVAKDGIQRARVNIFGRVSTLSGRVASIFEDTVGVDQPSELLDKALLTSQVYWKAVPLKSGLYKLELAVKDINGDRIGTLTRSIRVPSFDEEKLSSSTLILADLMEKVAAKNIGTGNFILGDTKVRPRLDSADGKPARFQRAQRLNLWMQVYNLKADAGTSRNRATVRYELTRVEGNAIVLREQESLSSNGDQLTLQKAIPLANLQPGLYNLKVSVQDEVSRQTIDPSARFQLE